MNHKKRIATSISVICIAVIVACTCCIESSFAKEKGPPAPKSGTNGGKLTEQWVSDGYQYARYEVVKRKWSSFNYVTSSWQWLNKNDQLFYFDAKGHNSQLTISFGNNIGNVKVTVPLGDTNKKGQGVAKTAPKKGYYKIKAKKYVKETVCYVDRRVYINNTPRGKWKFNYVSWKTNKIEKVYSELVRKK